jgi:putative Holliday junction resolvase
LKSDGRILALDHGRVRVGAAVSDPLGVLARGIGTLANDATLIERLRAIVAEEGVIAVVVGMPYAPDGGLGERGREVSAFMDDLRSALGLPVEAWDESRTSADARAAMREAGMRKSKRREKGREDTMAARLLLQDYLDHGRRR